MTPAEWSRVCDLFAALRELPPEVRPDAAAELEPDPRIRESAVRLLDLHAAADDFLEAPVARVLPDLPAAGPRAGDRVGPYRLVEEIARGGMGVVFAAERADDVYDKAVAIKFLGPANLTADDRERFAYERRALAQVDHPAVARIIDGGTTGEGWPYMTMELVDGRSITRHCSEERLGPRARLTLFADVCRGLQAVHRAGVVHGDVKPDNVLVDSSGAPRVVDFGIAVRIRTPHSAPAQPALTPAYASPEQRRGEPITTASDVFSLGILLYELCSGRLPDGAASLTPAAVERAVRAGDLDVARRHAALVRGIGHVIARACAADPELRYASSAELAREVTRLLEGLPPAAMEGRPLHRLFTVAFRQRRRIAVVLVVVLAGLVGWAAVEQRARERIDRTRRFVGEARSIEHGSEFEFLLPRHDVGPYRSRLRRRVAALERELDRGWAVPVHYAIGVGKLHLGDNEGASRHLEEAWRQGLRAPEVTRSLVLALSRLHAEQLRTADEALEPEVAEQRLRATTRRYRDRLSGLLAQLEAVGGAEAGYVRVLSDSLIGRPEKAWRRLRRLDPANQDPRTFPLRGNLLMLRAMQLRLESPQRSLDLLRRAEAAFARAKAVWRSHPGIHSADCTRAVSETVFRWRMGAAEASPAAAVGSCSQALEIEPGGPVALSQMARLFSHAAQEELFRGEDPGDSVRRAIEIARQIEGDERWVAAARVWIGVGSNLLAKWTLLQGGDPTPMIEDSVRHLEAALRLTPDDATALNGLGVAWGLAVRYREGRGLSVEGALERSIAAFEKALALEPFTPPHVNLGVGHQKRAELALRRGEDPAPWLARSKRHFDRVLEMAPGRAVYWQRAAGADLVAVRLAVGKGDDPIPHVDNALAKLRRAMDTDPECFECRLTLAETLLLQARLELERGRAPGVALDEALAVLSPAASSARGGELLAEARRLREAESAVAVDRKKAGPG